MAPFCPPPKLSHPKPCLVPCRPIPLESFPDITFSDIPSWLTHPLPWFGREDRGDWRQSSSRSSSSREDNGSSGGNEVNGGDGEAVAPPDVPPAAEVLQRQQWRDWLKSERGGGHSSPLSGRPQAGRGSNEGGVETPAQSKVAPGESQEATTETGGEKAEAEQWRGWRLERRARRSTGSEGGGGSERRSGRGMPAADQHDEEWRQMRRQPSRGHSDDVDVPVPVDDAELGQGVDR